MTEQNQTEEAPALNALGGPDVASGDLPIGLHPLIEAGVHFGHQTQRWNPKMRQFIYGSRNGIHIINLDQTAEYFKRAYSFIVEVVARGGHVLFVGTKRQAAEVIAEEATRAGQFHVNGRWLGGTLTNFRTVKARIDRLRSLEQMLQEGTDFVLSKRETLGMEREQKKLTKYVGGIKEMDSVPAAIFVVDPSHEDIAVQEGRKLHIPIIALTDTNCDPDLIDFIIPGNDDAMRSIKLITARIADACLEGATKHREFLQTEGARAMPNADGVQVEFARRRGSALADSVPGETETEAATGAATEATPQATPEDSGN